MRAELKEYLAGDNAIASAQLAGADALLVKWRETDERINSYIAVGDNQSATQVALGDGEDDSTPSFDRLNEALTNGIQESRKQLRNDILSARRVLSGTTVGGAVLSISAALAVGLGLWPRMGEYR